MSKPFDLEAAKAGNKVITREGWPVRILCFDKAVNSDYSIVALVKNPDGFEVIEIYNTSGLCNSGCTDPSDLFMAPVKVMKWALIMPARKRAIIYGTQEAAEQAAAEIGVLRPLITPIEWEE